MQFTDRGKGGFTLLETLIAFTVFSIFIIAVHKSFVSGTKGHDTASWTNAIGQAVSSEFALIEAGARSERKYEKELFDRYFLEVDVSPVAQSQGGFAINTSFLGIAVIKVHDIENNSSVVFSRIVFLERD